jgi:hypothetical protein
MHTAASLDARGHTDRHQTVPPRAEGTQSRRVRHDSTIRRWYALLAVSTLVIGALALLEIPTLSAASSSGGVTPHAGSVHTPTTTASTPEQTSTVNTSPPQSGSSDQLESANESAAPATTPEYGCTAALAYLAGHANPEFTSVCPGYADGNEAMTCVNIPGLCEGEHLIVINDPCPAAYMNEAYNSQSWSDSEAQFTRPIDPYGAC